MQNRNLVAEAALELKRRREFRAPLIDDSFPEQAMFVRDSSRFSGACTTRRAGKSTGLCYKKINAGKKHPGSFMPFIGLTRESAKNIIFPAFYEVSKKHSLGLEFRESDLTISMPGNSKVQLFGADMKNFIERLRGIKTPCASIDEGQSFKGHLEQLVDDILTPATADYIDGQINLTGTPGPVPKGYFYECSQGMHGFSMHHWTVYQNIYFPRPRDFVANLFRQKGWTNDTPTYRREWKGEWVADTDALVYKFNRDRNTIPQLPKGSDYYYVIGVDLGYSPDPSAFVVGAFSRYDSHLYILSSEVHWEMDVSSVAERVKTLMAKYPAARVVMDLGAQGKMIGAEIQRRFKIPVLAAEKTGKAGFIEIFNSELLQGVVKLVDGHTENLQEEWMNLIWDTETEQRTEDKRYPNHCSDAALYLARHCYNYAWEHRPEVVARGSEREMDLYWEKETEKMESLKWDEKRRKRDEDELFG